MASQVTVVPGPEHESAYHVLGAMMDQTMSLRAAVAFVTSSGVGLLEELLAQRSSIAVHVVARGAPITEPSALRQLADLGAEVSLIVGARAHGFHPKLWLAAGSGGLQVLAGSGNLTEGGLRANDEQFEYLRLSPEDVALIDQHERRFQVLTQHAVPLDELRDTPFWAEWENQVAIRRELATRARQLDDQLAANAGADLAQAQLYRDLLDLYKRTKTDVRIPAPGGGDRPYVASRFKQAIDRGRRESTLVPVVARIVRRPTEGFEHLAEAGRPDLMVETLVLDETKPYHRLFSEATLALARANLDSYHASRR